MHSHFLDFQMDLQGDGRWTVGEGRRRGATGLIALRASLGSNPARIEAAAAAAAVLTYPSSLRPTGVS
ncbi:MAG: hypothetical protein Fur0042_04470 [Cyanophyceae cyanobacterium]